MSKLLAVLDKLPVVAFTLFVPTMFFWTFQDMGLAVSLAISVLWWVLVFRAGWINLDDIYGNRRSSKKLSRSSAR